MHGFTTFVSKLVNLYTVYQTIHINRLTFGFVISILQHLNEEQEALESRKESIKGRMLKVFRYSRVD